MAKKETLKEKFERVINDPKIKNDPRFQNMEKFADNLDELTNKIVEPCLQYANDEDKNDEGWVYTILIALARATCHILYATQETQVSKGKDVFDFYCNELLPLTKEMAYNECKMKHEMSKKIEKGAGMSMDIQKDLLLAIADESVPVDDIIAKFFKKETPDEERKKIVEHIEYLRRERADELRKGAALCKGN